MNVEPACFVVNEGPSTQLFHGALIPVELCFHFLWGFFWGVEYLGHAYHRKQLDFLIYFCYNKLG